MTQLKIDILIILGVLALIVTVALLLDIKWRSFYIQKKYILSPKQENRKKLLKDKELLESLYAMQYIDRKTLIEDI